MEVAPVLEFGTQPRAVSVPSSKNGASCRDSRESPLASSAGGKSGRTLQRLAHRPPLSCTGDEAADPKPLAFPQNTFLSASPATLDLQLETLRRCLRADQPYEPAKLYASFRERGSDRLHGTFFLPPSRELLPRRPSLCQGGRRRQSRLRRPLLDESFATTRRGRRFPRRRTRRRSHRRRPQRSVPCRVRRPRKDTTQPRGTADKKGF